MNNYIEKNGEIEICDIIDKDLYSKFLYRIDEGLMKKYNSIKKFGNDETGVEEGCMNEAIKDIKYLINENNDNFIIVNTSTYNRCIMINKPSDIKIDRKYNSLELRLG